jgi:NAD(P)H-flavin reductase/ferredoxin
MDKIKLTIDGKPVEIAPGATVLEAARSGGIEIPTICAHEDLPSYGACRMCIVEIDNVRGYPTSCTTPAAEGMVVRTQTPELIKLRGRILEYMMSGHPNACLVCNHRAMCEQYRPRPIKAGRTTRCAFCSNRDGCDMRKMTLDLMKGDLNLPTLYSAYDVERDDPFIDRDYNLCILCGRCWRICEKIHGTPAISIINRGKWARIGTSFHKSYVFSGCTFCGACVDICPTGTLNDRYARWYGEPDRSVFSTCTLCPEGCTVRLQLKDARLISTRTASFGRDDRLCAIGRFAYPQIVNAPDRLRRALIRDAGDQMPADYESAIAHAAAKLGPHKGDSFAMIVSESLTRESRHYLGRFAREVINGQVGSVPAGGGFAELRPDSLRADLAAGKIKAAFVTGDFLGPELLAKIETLIVADFLPSPASERATALLPAAVLSEVDGTYRNCAGLVKPVAAANAAPGVARPEWMIARDLARAMSAPGFDADSAAAITPAIEHDPAPAPVAGAPRDKVQDVPVRVRGHYIADIVCALEAIGLPVSPPKPAPETLGEGFLIVEKKEIIPNFHLVTVAAPIIARFAQPGQFVIVMARENSERTPFTLCDWDAQAGTITLVLEEVGRSSREVALLRQGDRIAHVTGPLGSPHEIKNLGTVALGGGCYGIGGIYPIARALKAAGNKVISVIEASTQHLLYWEDKLRAVSDEVLIATKDGSRDTKGGVQEVFVNLIEGGTKIDAFVAIGCTFMMRMVAEATKPYGVPLQVALNPIMVDGTGMCGACRVSVGGQTKFACVDGPMFDGHQVDWDELFSRRGAYAVIEIEALPQDAHVAHREPEGAGSCMGTCGQK